VTRIGGLWRLFYHLAHVRDFMYMGHAGDLVLYKHRDTRRYLNIDAVTGRFYRYADGCYIEVERDWVLDHVQGLI
jgi:hypothetical protein